MIFEHEQTQALLKGLKLYRKWVQSAAEQAEEKDPEIEAGLQTLADAEAFIMKLDADVTERAKRIGYRWDTAQEFDIDDF